MPYRNIPSNILKPNKIQKKTYIKKKKEISNAQAAGENTKLLFSLSVHLSLTGKLQKLPVKKLVFPPFNYLF